MVALNFQPQFAPLVEARTKRQTIRHSDRVRVGQRLQLYTGTGQKETVGEGGAVFAGSRCYCTKSVYVRLAQEFERNSK